MWLVFEKVVIFGRRRSYIWQGMLGLFYPCDLQVNIIQQCIFHFIKSGVGESGFPFFRIFPPPPSFHFFNTKFLHRTQQPLLFRLWFFFLIMVVDLPYLIIEPFPLAASVLWRCQQALSFLFVADFLFSCFHPSVKEYCTGNTSTLFLSCSFTVKYCRWKLKVYAWFGIFLDFFQYWSGFWA